MSSKKEVVEMLCQSCEEIGLVETLHTVFGNNVKVSIPFSKVSVDTPIDELDFSVRASNCLHRAKHETIGDIIDVINNEELARYRNIGKKTVSEIKTKLLVYGYYKLSNIEKKSFWYDFLERNYIARERC
jgi:DNA-directed RNA polymerase alpha subunit